MKKQTDSFTKNNTLALKGIAILLMTFERMFIPYEWVNYNLDYNSLHWISPNYELIKFVAHTCRICVCMFAFLSAYAYQTSVSKNPTRSEWRYSIYRIIQLQLYFLPVFAFSIITVGFTNYNLLVDCYGEGKHGILNIIIDGIGLTDYFGTPSFNYTWWYISFAYLLILIVPTWSRWYKKEKVLSILIPLALCEYLIHDNNSFNSWMLSDLINIPLGIMFAEEDLFSKIAQIELSKKTRLDRGIKLIVYLLSIIIFFYIRKEYNFVTITDPLMAVIVSLIYYEYISKIKIIDLILQFLGKYSRDMWLCQVAVLLIAMKNFIYGLHYPIAIFGVAVFVTLVISFLISWVEKKVGYGKVVKKIASTISGYKNERFL